MNETRRNEFVTQEIAIKLKELGFDEECFAYYCKEAIYLDHMGNRTNLVLLTEKIRGELSGHGAIKNSLFKWLLDSDTTWGELHTLSQSATAPLWQQAIIWLLDKHNINITLDKFQDVNVCYYKSFINNIMDDADPIIVNNPELPINCNFAFPTPYEAFEHAIKIACSMIGK